MRSDSDIKRDVEDELRWMPDLDSTDIGVDMKKGVVTLTGFVRSYSHKIHNHKLRGGHNMKRNALVYTVAVGLLASSLMPVMICHATSDKPATKVETKQEGDKAMRGAMKAQAEDAIGHLSWEPGAGKSYSIPAVEIIGFDFLLNQFDRNFIDAHEYGSNLTTFRHDLTHKWVVDNDPFATNQFLHPYQGSMYHGFARSAGLNYWESLGYAFAGSVLWETAGETTPPSINDQIASGIGRTFLGEPLFRMASLLLERGGQVPRFWRELGAAVISPPTGFNRFVFGDRFDAVLPSRHPTFNWHLQLGGSWTAHNGLGASQSVSRSEAIADFALAYGLPGKADYTYTRPFVYFNFEFTASSASIFENIMARGLLVGSRYGAGEASRGVWGLYGSYDYIAPQIFRISSTALSLGTTVQWWLSKTVALQGTVLAGVGYGGRGDHPRPR